MKENNIEKKVYEEPVVEKVEFDFSDRIAASGCYLTTVPGGDPQMTGDT